MKILFIVPYIPSLIYVRPFNLIRYLSQRGHRIHLLTFITSEADQQAITQLESYCEVTIFPLPKWRSLLNAALALPTSTPLQAVYCWQSEAARWLEQRLAKGIDDIVHVEHLRGVRYGLLAQQTLVKSERRVPVLWDSVDSISHLFNQAANQATHLSSRLITSLEKERTAYYEGEMVSKFQQVLVTSPVDRQALLSQVPVNKNANISVLPNGSDLTYFSVDANVPREPATLVVSGKMSYHANIAMTLYLVREILPIVWATNPDVKLWIVGKDPSKELLALQKYQKILVTGRVDDIRPYLRQATLSVSPLLYGAGIQNKILEAMACGTPVITTSLATQSLAVKNGSELCVADNPKAFAQTILELLDNPKKREQIGQAGRQYVELNHDWSKIVQQLEAVYMQIAQQTTEK
jgi:sugar transferase (PEP-CTERM/EpsH1 system associated)